MSLLSKESFPKIADVNAQLCAASAAKVSSYVNVAKYARLYAAASLGTLDSGTATLQLYQATDTSGTSAKVLGSAVTSTTNGACLEVQVNVDAMDSANGFTCAAVSIAMGSDTGGTGAYVSAILFGVMPDYIA